MISSERERTLSKECLSTVPSTLEERPIAESPACDSSDDLSVVSSRPGSARLLPWRGPLSNLTADQVAEFLKEAPLPFEVSDVLQYHAISGDVLEILSDADLIAMGIDKLGWRRQVDIWRQDLRDHLVSIPQDSFASPQDGRKAESRSEAETSIQTQKAELEAAEVHNEELDKVKKQLAESLELLAEVELSRDLAEAKVFALQADLGRTQKSQSGAAPQSCNSARTVAFKSSGQRVDQVGKTSSFRTQSVPRMVSAPASCIPWPKTMQTPSSICPSPSVSMVHKPSHFQTTLGQGAPFPGSLGNSPRFIVNPNLGGVGSKFAGSPPFVSTVRSTHRHTLPTHTSEGTWPRHNIAVRGPQLGAKTKNKVEWC